MRIVQVARCRSQHPRKLMAVNRTSLPAQTCCDCVKSALGFLYHADGNLTFGTGWPRRRHSALTRSWRRRRKWKKFA